MEISDGIKDYLKYKHKDRIKSTFRSRSRISWQTFLILRFNQKFMTINIETLLALPQKERKKIAEQLWNSLSPANNLTKEDEKIVDMLDKRWNNIQSGKSKLYSSEALKEMIASYRK